MDLFSGRSRCDRIRAEAKPSVTRGWWKRKVWVLPVVGLVAVLAYMSVVQLETLWILRHEKEELQKNIVELEDEQENMEREIEKMQTPEWMEQAAREELDLVKPGDLLVIPENRGRKEPLDSKDLD